MLSKREKVEASERAVHQSDLQKRFIRSVRKSVRTQTRNHQTKAAPKITTKKTNTSGARE